MTATKQSAEWRIVHNPWGDCWAHQSLPVWIVEYEPIEGYRDRSFFKAYIAVAPSKKDRHPCQGGVDSRRIGSDRGYASFDACAEAVLAHVATNRGAA